jgi:carboxyl-terminal processing protease
MIREHIVNRTWQRLSIFVITLTLGAGGLLVSPLAASQDPAEDKLFRDYVAATEIIKEKYVEPLEYDLLSKAGISGMLRTLDPHSNFYDRKGFEEFRREQRSHYFGIGASIQRRYRGVYIIEPFKDAPATRAGLRYGDQIIGIDGKDTEKWTSDQVRDSLRGELGTQVKVTVRRASSPEPVNITIERGTVDLPSIASYYMIRPGVGYINHLRGFHSTTSDELQVAVNELKEQGAKSLILDLRGNPGGFLDQAIKVSDKFLDRSQLVVSVRGREGRIPNRDWSAESGSPETMPLVVLINRGSASASEIVAGAMQDHDRALIIGDGSFGKGLVQTIFPLSGGAGLTLTTQRYYTPSGRLIQRDYSNGSFYEYITRRNSQGQTKAVPEANKEQKRTDLGRTVYGGGGIDPDVKVEAPTISNAQFEVWTTGLFMFTRELAAGKVAAAANFKIERVSHGHQLKGDEFVITDVIMAAYKSFMADFIAKNADTTLTRAIVDQNLDWAKRKIREELLIAAYGNEVAQHAMVDFDPQLQRAIQELPNSAALADRARRVTRVTPPASRK